MCGRQPAGGRFGFFEFGLVGVPLVVGTILIVVRVASGCCRSAAPDDYARPQRPRADARRALNLEQATLTSCHERDNGCGRDLVPPRSELVGQTAFCGMVTESGDFVVLAIRRRDEELTGNCELAAGDTLLVQGTWGALD